MIKAILFDFDGVLTIDKTGSQSIIKYLARITGISIDLLEKEYYKYNEELLYGKITHKDMWQSFCDTLGTSIEYDTLIDAFRNTPIDSEMIDLVKEFKKVKKIGMITDNKRDRIDEVLGFNKLRPLFDVVSVSADYHSGKEERLIFDKTISALSVKPEQCVFIDNTENNLVIPQRMGMHTILFDDENRSIAALKRELLAL